MPGVHQRLKSSSQKPTLPEPPKKISRGGVHQRSSAASSSVSEPSQPGVHQRLGKPESLDTCEKAPLQHSLGKDWCRGRTPTSSCLKYAKDAKASGAVNLGAMAEGSSKSNRFRKMKRAVGWPPAATPISYIEIPTKSAGPGFLNPHPILCPIDSFERAMADSERRIKYLCNDLREIPTFWDNMENTDLFRTISGNIDREKTFPFFVHGDGAPTNKVDGLFTISIGSLLARGPTKSTRFIYTCIREADITDETLNELFTDLAVRLNILTAGVQPDLDKKGRPNPNKGKRVKGGFKVAVIFLKGDWEFYANVLHLPRWDNKNNM